MNASSGGGEELSKFTKMAVERHPKVNVKFSDVAGMKEAKFEVQEFVDYFDNFKKYQKLGGKIPRGAIFFGSPGVGKTLLAKALAGEAEVPFYSVSGSEFVEIFVGVGASRVRDLFGQARKEKKAIIFIDEIDAIGRPRESSQLFGGSGDERQNTLNQLLLELDGFTENDNVLVFGSTNVDREGLDSALLRPGRFDREIYIEKPDKEERQEIFKLYLDKLKCTAEVFNENNMETYSNLTVGLTGADINTICNEAGIFAVRKEKEKVSPDNVEEAIERIIAGIESKDSLLTEDEKKRIAYYQSGLAVSSFSLETCDPVLKLSLVQKGGKFGFTQYLPEDKYIQTFQEMKEKITHLISGRVTEKLVFGDTTTHATEDLKKLTMIAYSAISTFGFGDEVSNLSFLLPGSEGASMQKQYGDETAWKIDKSVKKLINESYEESKKILVDNRKMLDKIAEELLEKEVMGRERLNEIFHDFSKKK